MQDVLLHSQPQCFRLHTTNCLSFADLNFPQISCGLYNYLLPTSLHQPFNATLPAFTLMQILSHLSTHLLVVLRIPHLSMRFVKVI